MLRAKKLHCGVAETCSKRSGGFAIGPSKPSLIFRFETGDWLKRWRKKKLAPDQQAKVCSVQIFECVPACQSEHLQQFHSFLKIRDISTSVILNKQKKKHITNQIKEQSGCLTENGYTFQYLCVCLCVSPDYIVSLSQYKIAIFVVLRLTLNIHVFLGDISFIEFVDPGRGRTILLFPVCVSRGSLVQR